MKRENNIDWWSEKYGYFGSFYMKADTLRDSNVNKEKNLLDRTRAEIDGVVHLLSLKKNMRILDCPCGYGRHSIELASRGFIVEGVDLNLKHLQKAIDECGKVSATFKKENMININYFSEFNAVINMFASFGFFKTDKENEKVLKNFFNALKPKGKFLMHIDINISKIIHGNNKHTSQKNLITGETLLIEDIYYPNTKRLNGSWTIKKENKETTKNYSVRIYTKEEFEQMCRKIGFSSVKTYSNWNGDIYTENSNDMIVVAVK